MTEIICILKEELKYDGTVKHDQNTNSECVNNPTVNSSQCGNCAKLESQLKETTDNLSSVKLITAILNKKIKSMKQTTHMASNTNNPWSTVNSNKSRSPTSVQPPRKEHLTYGIPIAHQYTVPVENRYTMLSSYQESQTANEVLSPSDTMHTTRFTTTKNRKYNMGPWKKKNTSLNQHGSSVTHPSNKHNLQKRG